MSTWNDSNDREHRSDDKKRRFEMNPRRVMKIAGLVILGIIAAIVFALVFGILVMWLWNSLMPPIFGLGRISYWQAFGLIILSKLLFGCFGTHGHHKKHWHKHGRHHDYMHWKMKHHFQKFEDSCCCGDDDDLWKPKGSYKNWRHYEQYWKDKGKADFEEYIDKIEGDQSEKPRNL